MAALAAGFCIWSALGNEVNLCVTSGCALFQDTSIAGISLWWAGGVMFAALGAAALMGAAPLGMILAGLALLGDIGLLLLMSVTAPCVSCLIVACLFAMIYAGFRQAAHRSHSGLPNDKPGRSLLLVVWSVLFVVNVGTALRTLSAATAVTLGLAEPITAATLGVVVLHESLAAAQWVGLAAVLAGVLIAGLTEAVQDPALP